MNTQHWTIAMKHARAAGEARTVAMMHMQWARETDCLASRSILVRAARVRNHSMVRLTRLANQALAEGI